MDIDFTKQSYIYFNAEDGDLKVLNRQSADQEEWVSVTQHTLNPVDDPDADFNEVIPASAIRVLKHNVGELEQSIADLKAKIAALP